jgi:hypothetical protein
MVARLVYFRSYLLLEIGTARYCTCSCSTTRLTIRIVRINCEAFFMFRKCLCIDRPFLFCSLSVFLFIYFINSFYFYSSTWSCRGYRYRRYRYFYKKYWKYRYRKYRKFRYRWYRSIGIKVSVSEVS